VEILQVALSNKITQNMGPAHKFTRNHFFLCRIKSKEAKSGTGEADKDQKRNIKLDNGKRR